jgi:hypothetical protein
MILRFLPAVSSKQATNACGVALEKQYIAGCKCTKGSKGGAERENGAKTTPLAANTSNPVSGVEPKNVPIKPPTMKLLSVQDPGLNFLTACIINRPTTQRSDTYVTTARASNNDNGQPEGPTAKATVANWLTVGHCEPIRSVTVGLHGTAPAIITYPTCK